MPVDVIWTKKYTNEYEVVANIGSGGYGNVFLAKRRNNNQECVIKVVQRTESYIRELDHLLALRKCYRVLPVKRCVITNNELCLEFPRGECSLYEYIKNRTPGRNRAHLVVEALSFTAQILTSLKIIHDMGIAHRDMKTKNIIVMRDDNGVPSPRIIDFGMSKRIGFASKDFSFYAIVTSSYRAPELWTAGDACGAVKPYDQKIDIWSVGCILYEMLMGEPAFTGSSEEDVGSKIGGHLLHVMNDVAVYDGAFKHPLVAKNLEDTVKQHLRKPKPVNKLHNHMKNMSLKNMIPPNDAPDWSLFDIEEITQCATTVMMMMLHPIPAIRCTAQQALDVISKYKFHAFARVDQETKETTDAVWTNMVEPISTFKKDAIDMVEKLYIACNIIHPNPTQVYIALYAWIRCLCGKNMMANNFGVETMLVSSLRLAGSYCSEHPDDTEDLCTQVRVVTGTYHFSRVSIAENYRETNFGEDSMDLPDDDPPTPTVSEKMSLDNITPMEHQIIMDTDKKCESSIITHLHGRVWSKNPDDFRHKTFACKRHCWDQEVDRSIFAILLQMLDSNFTPPNPVVIMERAKKIYSLLTS